MHYHHLSTCFHLFEILQTARDEIQSLEDFHNVGWLRVDLQPIKQVLTTYAAKWMWTYTKYLSDQVCMHDTEWTCEKKFTLLHFQILNVLYKFFFLKQIFELGRGGGGGGGGSN